MSLTIELIAFNKDEAEKALIEFFEQVRNNNLGEQFIKLKAAYKYEDEDIMAELENMYLHFRSESVLVSSPMGDDQHLSQLEAMVEYFNLEMFDTYNIPTKDSLIELYKLINNNNLNDIAEKFNESDDYELADAREILMETIIQLKPLVKKLKFDADSILIISSDSEFPNVIPEDFDSFLQKRISELKISIETDSEIFNKLK